jgi:chaperone modulatory protein CbpM
MNETITSFLQGQVVEEEIHLTLTELCQTSGITEAHVTTLVVEGILEPIGRQPAEWRFGGDSLRRARLALRLARDLDINPAGVALVMDLLDEIDSLRARIRRGGNA